jgi:hypothetical protein
MTFVNRARFFRFISLRELFLDMNFLNAFVARNLFAVEMTGVLMRISSFSVVSWMGADSPYLLIWLVNTVDAVMLSWCSILKKDKAYTILNVFWILVGIVGVLRAGNLLH